MEFFRKKYLYEVIIRCDEKMERFMFESNDKKCDAEKLIKKVYGCLYKTNEDNINVVIKRASLRKKKKYYMEEENYV